MNEIQVIDRKERKVVQTILNPSGQIAYSNIQFIHGFDIEKFPYLLLKDIYMISIIDVRRMTAYKLIKSLNFYCRSCLYQTVEDDKLKLITLDLDEQCRELKKYEISNIMLTALRDINL